MPPRPALLIITSTPPKRSAAVEQRLDLLLLGHVTDQAGDPVDTELGAEGLLGLCQPTLVGVADNDRPGALLQAASGDGGADARTGGSRDDDDLAREQVVSRDVVGGGCRPSWSSHAPFSR